MQLQYRGAGSNQYVDAIRAVCNVLAPYDSDGMIPVFGFGAKLVHTGQVSHCFNVNFQVRSHCAASGLS